MPDDDIIEWGPDVGAERMEENDSSMPTGEIVGLPGRGVVLVTAAPDPHIHLWTEQHHSNPVRTLCGLRDVKTYNAAPGLVLDCGVCRRIIEACRGTQVDAILDDVAACVPPEVRVVVQGCVDCSKDADAGRPDEAEDRAAEVAAGEINPNGRSTMTNAEVAALRADLEVADEHVRSLTGERDALRDELKTAEDRYTHNLLLLRDMKEQNDALRAERDELRERLKAHTRVREVVAAEVERMRPVVEAAEALVEGDAETWIEFTGVVNTYRRERHDA
jgi:hypothetical protein